MEGGTGNHPEESGAVCDAHLDPRGQRPEEKIMIDDSTQYIARISHGKDSLKMLQVIKARGLPLDRITTTDVWATDPISVRHGSTSNLHLRHSQIIPRASADLPIMLNDPFFLVLKMLYS